MIIFRSHVIFRKRFREKITFSETFPLKYLSLTGVNNVYAGYIYNIINEY